MKLVTVDGNEACSNTAYMFTEVAGIYPITPASPMAEHVDEWSNNGVLNIFNDKVKVVEMQSEAGAAGMIHGSLQAGILTTTFTASQGLLLMIPNMYKIAGEMLPCVIHVAARSLATHALSIFGDHQDIYATRQTGFAILASSSVQDASYLAAVAHLATIKGRIPFVHFYDGFRTSHELHKINMLERDDIKDLVDYDAIKSFRNNSLQIGKPITRGTAQNDDIYFQATEVRNPYYDNIVDTVVEYMDKINKITKSDYKPFNYYGSKSATNVIVAMGSVCETIKETIDDLNEKGYEIGLVEVHLYRPFSTKYLKKVLPKTVKRIAVLDRTKEFGSIGEPLYLDVVAALKDENLEIYGGRYGLSSKNTTPAQIKAVFDFLARKPHHNFTIGIKDDVTNLSLKIDDKYKISNSHELLLYGYGSDGMVSAAKILMSLIGNETNNIVQGYFQYDSKKSGGVTVGHLRFNKNKIRSTYYVENPELVMVTKDSYLKDFDTLSKIKENGIFILNTSKSEDEIKEYLDDNLIKIINDRKIKFYIINAYELARKVGLKNKISMIMAATIFELTDIVNRDEGINSLKESVKKKFFKKGEAVIKANNDAIDLVKEYLHQVKLTETSMLINEENEYDNVIQAINHRKGDELPTSAFAAQPDGTFIIEPKNIQQKGISDVVPKWVPKSCIQCNQCAFVCPHSVIRPFLLNQEEYDKAPKYIQERALKAMGKANMYYVLGISITNCTGCGLCMKTCPSKQASKALVSSTLVEQYKDNEQKVFDYLEKNISEKIEYPINSVKGSQFKKPKFSFCGACAGCGETSYIKVLTQLFGEHMMIANATGCSSIYGGGMPVLPYTIPWSNSLFEDNAEYGYGMLIGNKTIRNRIAKIMQNNLESKNKELFTKWLDNFNDYEITKEVAEQIDYSETKELEELKEYIPYRSIWTIGGDGWAYDIGYGGIDHVLASNDDVNILVLDSQVYSNTGGQSSKSSPAGSIASFAASGKKNNKKDLAKIALAYPHVYVATVSLGANMIQLLKAFKEAENHKGPSIIIAYAPCISHGIEGGMENTLEMQKLAVNSGYFPLFRYNPAEEKFYLDSKADFDLYEEFLLKQNRYSMLKIINPIEMNDLLLKNKEHALKTYEYYKSLVKEGNEE
ncbi:MAG: pyruvate:ferredoxin (flavodoxin) oxidoreductase [Bacilli bacterium]|nr:pyruvate:ferredoxin (flavodoxin) oxidoreductase [Bacilli bacterium]